MSAWIALGRSLFNLVSESDYLGRFIAEAQAVRDGAPLAVDIHLPGYAILLATVQTLTKNWLASGLLISWVSALLSLAATWRLFSLIGNGWVALGAVGALAASSLFLAFGAQASTDLLMLAVFLWALVAAAQAIRSHSLLAWAVAGALAALAFLIRTNGVVLFALAVAPLLTAYAGVRLRATGSFLAGLLIPLAAWAAFAAWSHSPFLPTETHTNIAMTYFGSGGVCANETRVAMGQKFTSSMQVIATDPLHIATQYLRQLLGLPIRILNAVTWTPLAAAGAVALVLWLFYLRRSPAALAVFTIAILMTLLMNMKGFEARYYLYAAPFLGGAVGFAVSWLLNRFEATPAVRTGACVALCALFVLGAAVAAPAAREYAEPANDSRALRESIAAGQALLPPGAVVVARKHVIPFYTQRSLLWFPTAESSEDLCEPLDRVASTAPVYLYLGRIERRCRPELTAEVLSGKAQRWTNLVARGGSEQSPWAFAQFDRSGCRDTAALRSARRAVETPLK